MVKTMKSVNQLSNSISGTEGKREGNELKMNFSVGVSMYRANVTSYW